MSLQDEKPDGHRAVRLLKKRMLSRKHFGELNLVVIAFTHLLAINCNHIVMHPVSGRDFFIANGTLSDFTFMMRELKVHSASVNIKLSAQVFGSHGRTFYMPSWKTFAPGAFPAHDMFGWSSFP